MPKALVYEKKNNLLIMLIAFIFMGGCTPSQPTITQSSESTSEIQTNLEVVSDSTLRVSFASSRPIKELFFKRTPDAQRMTRWMSLDDTILIEHKNGVDIIKHSEGASFSKASFDVPMTYTVLPKDYAPFMPYRKNGILIHSGRFQICAEICDDNNSATFPMSISFPKPERLILLGKNLTEATSWTDMQDGTMIYIGHSTATETDYVLSIVDPYLPDDVKEPLSALFPQLMAYYADRLGALAQKPMLFASFDRYAKPDGNPNSNSFSTQGGTLPGQVFMHFTGDAWFEEKSVRGQEMTESLLWFFAHESGHLYQRATKYSPSDADAWIHEGGADAFATLALLDLNAVSSDYVDERINKAIKLCLKGLSKGRLDSAAKRGDFDILYTCGMTIQLAVDKAIRQKSNGQSDLFDLWALFLRDVEAGKPWNQITFLDLVETQAGVDARNLAMSIISADTSLSFELLKTAVQ